MTEEQTPTPAPEGKSTNAKLAAAVIGGYVLGRTKKGRAAFKLASRLSGNQAGPQAMSMAWTGLSQVAPSAQAPQIMEALGEVGGTTVKGTAETVKGTAETVSDTTKKAAGGVKGAVGKLTGRKKGEAEEEKPEEEFDEGEKEEQDEEPRPTKEQGRQPHKKGRQPHKNQ